MTPLAMFRLTLILMIALLAAACGTTPPATNDGDQNGAQEETGDDADDDDAGGDGNGASTATISLTLSGGGNAGNFTAEAPDAGCSRNPLGENTFGLQYSVDEPQGFTSLQIIINDAEAAKAGDGTDDFIATVTIGPLFGEGSTSYDIKPTDEDTPAGTGTITLDDRGDSATMVIDGTTDDGVGVDATVECHGVFDFS